ncbi:7-carboxy-7-deazaguanine synthase QueE, partial [Francisellaceae bacterium]|nr:7-carboxy-7-deazaguanine synthase QueE [Francisellaceae bacterium]
TGCTHRCYFGKVGGWCDTWYSSIHAEKGKYCFDDIIRIYQENPNIKEMMLTGGSPTMHPAFINELTIFAKENDIFITLETEGSHFFETSSPIDLISLSPKFSNTIPMVGMKTPKGKMVDQRMVDQHNKYRLQYVAIEKLINYHKNYQYKPVWDGSESCLQEIESFRNKLGIPKEKTYVMPAGQTREQLIKMYAKTIDMCLAQGYRFTGRTHIIAFDDKRAV